VPIGAVIRIIDEAADGVLAYAAVADGCMTLSWKTVARKRKPSSIDWTKLKLSIDPRSTTQRQSRSQSLCQFPGAG
jgi:hypothetical protein